MQCCFENGFWAWPSCMLRNQFRKQHCKNTASKNLNYRPLVLNQPFCSEKSVPSLNYHFLCFSSAVEVPSYFFGWYYMDKWGRRWILFVTMMLGGLSCISCMFVPVGKKLVLTSDYVKWKIFTLQLCKWASLVNNNVIIVMRRVRVNLLYNLLLLLHHKI